MFCYKIDRMATFRPQSKTLADRVGLKFKNKLTQINDQSEFYVTKKVSIKKPNKEKTDGKLALYFMASLYLFNDFNEGIKLAE
jgi:hypothetical protein